MSLSDIAAWWARARTKVDPKDLLWLTPPGVARILAGFMSARRSQREAPQPVDLSARDPETVELALELFRALGKHYFRLEVGGAEHVPASGPAMLVGNHNGGTLPIDVFFTMDAVFRRFGHDRIVHPLTHDGVLFHDTIRRYARALGVLRASSAAANKVLEAGRLVLVYPGSDIDASRAFTERHRIELAGRKGFLRVALRHRAPIIPVVSVGTHEQLIILTRGERIARALRLHKLIRTDTFPISLSVPWGLNLALLPYLPLPAQTSVLFGPPISWPALGPEHADDPEVLERCYAEVSSKMQALLDTLSEGRIPFLGKLR